MKMNNKNNFRIASLGTTTLLLCVLMSGCTSQQPIVESSAPVGVEDEAASAIAGADNATVSASDSATIIQDAPPAAAEAGNDIQGMTPVVPDPVAAENLEQTETLKKQPKYNQDDVIWIQTRLKDLGYYQGPVDGSAGKATRNAVMEYQRDQDVTADGNPTAELREFMWLNGG